MTLLLTGATGYVGKHILAALLQAGERVVAVVRPQGGVLAERVMGSLAPFRLPAACLAPERLQILAGDVTAPDLGLSAPDRQWLAKARVEQVLHGAGLTRFDEHLAERIHQHNRLGTEQAYRLARALGVRAFHHVSTAFVAGLAEGAFRLSGLACGDRFRNPYEASKVAAEDFLREAAQRDGIPIHVYRPSVVVGGVPPVGEGQSTSTVYAFLLAGRFLMDGARRDLLRGQGPFAKSGARELADGTLHLPSRLVADPETTMNLTRADYVAAATVAGLRHEAQGYTVYPQIGSREVSLREMAATFTRILGVSGFELVSEAALASAPATFAEQCFARATSTYRPYLHNTTTFAQEAPAPGFPDPRDYPVDLDEVARTFLAFTGPAAARPAATVVIAAAPPNPTNPAVPSAPPTPRARGPREYFDGLVGGRLGQAFLRSIAFVDAHIAFVIDDSPPFRRTIHFRCGEAREPAPGKGGADCTFAFDRALFDAILEGREDLRLAFFKGRIRVDGDQEIGLKFGYLFGQHLGGPETVGLLGSTR
jgi:nucleoside-diphosphate-sugar epimerase